MSPKEAEGQTDRIGRPRYLTWLHGIGVILSITALILGGLDNPAIGFPIAIAILTGLGIPSSPKPSNPRILQIIHGSITKGGIRQGVFIKGMFGTALLYQGVTYLIVLAIEEAIFNLLLGSALIISSVASEIEARSVRQAINKREIPTKSSTVQN